MARLIPALILLSAFSSVPRARQAGPQGSFERFDRTLEALRAEHHVPGLAAAVIRDRRLAWSKAYGFADVGDDVPVTTDTPFWIASLTKTFVGLLFLQLEEAGHVNLDDRLWDVPGERAFCEEFSRSGSVFGRDLRCDRPITVREVLHHTVNGEPGARFLYNPVMYSRLSRYLEQRFGLSVTDVNGIVEVEGRQNAMAQLVEKHILGPAGMTRTMASQWQRDKMEVFFDMAAGYGIPSSGAGYVKRPRPGRSLKGGAGVVSTVGDLARFDIALDSGGLAPAAVMEKVFTPPHAPDGTLLPYAFGWYVQQYRGERLVWHSGWDEEAGFSAMYLKVPDRGLTLILLANGEGLWWENPLDRAAIETSPFAQAFLEEFVFRAIRP